MIWSHRERRAGCRLAAALALVVLLPGCARSLRTWIDTDAGFLLGEWKAASAEATAAGLEQIGFFAKSQPALGRHVDALIEAIGTRDVLVSGAAFFSDGRSLLFAVPYERDRRDPPRRLCLLEPVYLAEQERLVFRHIDEWWFSFPDGRTWDGRLLLSLTRQGSPLEFERLSSPRDDHRHGHFLPVKIRAIPHGT